MAPVVACISSYREGEGLVSTIESAAELDAVVVFEGPAGAGAKPPSGVPLIDNPLVSWLEQGAWESDAAKRSAMLDYVKERWPGAWILWLDGDELLLWGEYLRDHTRRAEAETGAGGFPLRLVELDGSVAYCYGKMIRSGNVARYLESSYQLELVSGMVVALPNVPICQAGGLPVFSDDEQLLTNAGKVELLATRRPPLQGEPHLLHRSILRDPARGVERLNEREPDWYAEHAP